jgi:hypothetical protein
MRYRPRLLRLPLRRQSCVGLGGNELRSFIAPRSRRRSTASDPTELELRYPLSTSVLRVHEAAAQRVLATAALLGHQVGARKG